MIRICLPWLGLAYCCLLGMLVGGCPQAVPVVGPAANLAACIATDVAESKPIAQIATDCGVDVLTIITSLLDSQDPKIQQSYAYQEAKNVRMTMKMAP